MKKAGALIPWLGYSDLTPNGRRISKEAQSLEEAQRLRAQLERQRVS